MNAVTEKGFADFKVADLSLADWGPWGLHFIALKWKFSIEFTIFVPDSLH